MLRAILVDDEQNSLSALREKISRHCQDIEIIDSCDSAQKAKSSIDSLHPDLVFLDIEMPVTNGFLLLQQLQFKKFDLIFTTAYDHYAIKAIRFSALDYLVKPIEIDELKTAVARATERRAGITAAQQLELLLENFTTQKGQFQKLAIPASDGLQFIPVDQILYLEANGNYTHFYMDKGKKYIASRTMKEFEDLLNPEIFLRIHNSYIINKNYVERYIRGEGGQVKLSNGVLLDVSKRKKAEFLRLIGR